MGLGLPGPLNVFPATLQVINVRRASFRESSFNMAMSCRPLSINDLLVLNPNPSRRRIHPSSSGAGAYSSWVDVVGIDLGSRGHLGSSRRRCPAAADLLLQGFRGPRHPHSAGRYSRRRSGRLPGGETAFGMGTGGELVAGGAGGVAAGQTSPSRYTCCRNPTCRGSRSSGPLTQAPEAPE